MYHQLFVNKFQPQRFDDFELETELQEILYTLINTNTLNLLLVGESGSGKTSLLNAIIREYYNSYEYKNYKDNVMYINSLKEQISLFIKNKNFKSEIVIVDDGENILDTGGGILNMINHSNENNFYIFNPDTIWKNNYLNEIKEMEKLYFLKQPTNMLFLVNKKLSFDKNLNGDFNLKNNLILKDDKRDFIYTGCQILNKKVLQKYKVEKFSIANIWDDLIKNKELYGFESKNDFYHLTDLKIFKKLQDL